MEGLTLEEEYVDPATNEEGVQLVEVPQMVLEQLKATVKVDVTPKGAYDKYARELSLENMFKAGMFNIEKLPELKVYVRLLPDDSVSPKPELQEAIKLMEEEQERIAIIQEEARIMQQRANQFLSEDPEAQISQINDAVQITNEEAQANVG